MIKRVYLSLGSNIGDREAMLKSAIHHLHQPDFRVCRISPIYETAPVDYTNQGDFLNCVVEAETELLPLRLLHRIQRIERELGRQRLIAKGPRTIDLDILLYGRAVVNAPQLKVPHPSMQDRRFVLQPLADLAPDLRHPVYRRTIRELLEVAPDQRLLRTPISIPAPV